MSEDREHYLTRVKAVTRPIAISSNSSEVQSGPVKKANGNGSSR